MSSQAITIKVDSLTKREAEHTARTLGVPLSVVLKRFLKQFIWTKSIPSSTTDEIPNAYFKRTLAKARKNYKEGKGSPVFDNIEDELKWLEQQGI